MATEHHHDLLRSTPWIRTHQPVDGRRTIKITRQKSQGLSSTVSLIGCRKPASTLSWKDCEGWAEKNKTEQDFCTTAHLWMLLTGRQWEASTLRLSSIIILIYYQASKAFELRQIYWFCPVTVPLPERSQGKQSHSRGRDKPHYQAIVFTSYAYMVGFPLFPGCWFSSIFGWSFAKSQNSGDSCGVF